MYAICHVTIYDYHRYRQDAFVLFDQTIVQVGLMKDYQPGDWEEIDGKGMLVMPGLINAHSHIYSTFARGVPVDFHPHSFQELLQQLWWKVDRNLDLDITYHSGLVAGTDYLRHGVTTIIDHHASGTIPGSLEALHKSLKTVGVRHALCFETSDRFAVASAINENVTGLHHYQTTFARSHFGLHASFSLSDDTLQQVSRQLNNAPIHIHVAESMEDQNDSLAKHGQRVIHRLDSYGLIQPGAILTHCNHVTEDELAIVAKRRAVIAVNPTSNMNNGVGTPDVKAMLSYDIPVILGNDGIHRDMTREYQSLYYAMHHRYQSPTAFGLDDLKTIITNTYQYASSLFGVSLGRIEPGYEADLVLIPYEHSTPINATNMMSHLFFGLYGAFVPHSVFIGGQPLIRNHQLPSELQTVKDDAKPFAKRLWDAIEKEGAK